MNWTALLQAALIPFPFVFFYKSLEYLFCGFIGPVPEVPVVPPCLIKVPSLGVGKFIGQSHSQIVSTFGGAKSCLE
jgi:hypothetical protein